MKQQNYLFDWSTWYGWEVAKYYNFGTFIQDEGLEMMIFVKYTGVLSHGHLFFFLSI